MYFHVQLKRDNGNVILDYDFHCRSTFKLVLPPSCEIVGEDGTMLQGFMFFPLTDTEARLMVETLDSAVAEIKAELEKPSRRISL